MRCHDFKLRSYTVSESGGKIELDLVYDYPGATERDSHIEFTDVVCYHFVHTEGTILTDINEEPLPEFVKKEEEFLVSAATQHGLRLWRSDAPDYLRRLEGGGYHAWRLESAIGFAGFVVARSVGERKEATRQAGGSPQTFGKMEERVSLRAVKTDDLPIFFVHQLDPEATRLAAFPSRDRAAFFTHWTTNILGNPAAVSRAILVGDQVAGNIGAWTDAASNERLICYWLGREFWGRGIASAAVSLLLQFESTRPLIARVAKHNLGSIRVLEKAGFTRGGEEMFSLPDHTPVEEIIYRLPA